MKICFLTGNIFTIGGVQRVLSVIASELSKYHTIDILCTDDNLVIDRKMYNLNQNVNIVNPTGLRNKNIINKVFKGINRITGMFNNNILYKVLTEIYFPRKMRKKLTQYLNDNKYDLIIGAEGYYSLLLGLISKEIDAKTIGWQHSSYNAYLNNRYRYYWNQDKLFKEYLHNLDKCIVLTEEDSKLYKEKLNINCDVIYNPLSFQSKIKSKCNDKSIIFVGRLVKQAKGLDLLIKAFSLVNQEKEDWQLKIVGDGPDRKKLIKYIYKYHLENNIILLGKSDNVKKHYLESSIFVSSSRWEGFGLAITEAMECGLPVIAFKNSGPKEIINKNNENGILVPCNDVEKLANTIIELIENRRKREYIAQKSIERAKDFSLKIIIQQWCEFIK
ncbi:glycosyltransferase family 4 protein [Clostridium weizhouense]|uniref:Glycosyltransferase family 4 protein n=1 Tax=Clostridium weizhouense TaxID=2859781 RepID=A0ABS7APE0_9CLOT|nr:glycosyltransferase family 4 protein [Clostridium weizhouense]MBW6410291.1 glycosyltransferase family 4 protein [Clostridium weizhouense]